MTDVPPSEQPPEPQPSNDPDPTQVKRRSFWLHRGRLLALVLAIAAIASVVAVGSCSSPAANPEPPQSSGITQRRSAIVTREVLTVPVGAGPSCLAQDQGGAVWVVSVGTNKASRVDAEGEVDLTVALPGKPHRCAWWAGGLWVGLSDSGRLVRVDAEQEQVNASVYVGEQPGEILASFGSLWVLTAGEGSTPSRLVRVDPATRRRVDSVPLAGRPVTLSAGGQGVMIGFDAPTPRVEVVDPYSLRSQPEEEPFSGSPPTASASASSGSVSSRSGSPSLGSATPSAQPVVRSAGVGGCARLRKVLVTDGLVWVVCQGDGSTPGQLVALDEGSLRLRLQMQLPGRPSAIQHAAGAYFWVYAADSGDLQLIDPRQLWVKSLWRIKPMRGQTQLQPSPVDLTHPIDIVLRGTTVWLAPFGQGTAFGFDVTGSNVA